MMLWESLNIEVLGFWGRRRGGSDNWGTRSTWQMVWCLLVSALVKVSLICFFLLDENLRDYYFSFSFDKLSNLTAFLLLDQLVGESKSFKLLPINL